MDVLEITKTLATSPTLAAIGIAFIIVFFGIRLLTTIDKEGPLAPYVFQILGLVIVCPILLTLAVTVDLSSEALTGFLGAIVGYFFGTKGETNPKS